MVELELIGLFVLTVVGSVVVSIPARRHEAWHRRTGRRFVGRPYSPTRKERP